MHEAWAPGNGISMVLSVLKGEGKTPLLAERVHDKLCKPHSAWKFLSAAKPSVEQERCPVPYLRVAAAPRSSSAAVTNRRGPLGAATATKVSFCRFAAGEKVAWVWLRGPSARELRVLSTGRRRRAFKLLLPPPARQHRLPDPLLPSLVPAHLYLHPSHSVLTWIIEYLCIYSVIRGRYCTFRIRVIFFCCC